MTLAPWIEKLLKLHAIFPPHLEIPGSLPPEFKRPPEIRGTLSRELPTPLEPTQLQRLSWSQLLELTRIDDPWKRAFFENECLNSRWSVRQLQRQIGSLP